MFKNDYFYLLCSCDYGIFLFWSLKHLTAQYNKMGIQCEFLLKDPKSQNICTFQFVIVYSKKKNKRTKDRIQSEVAWKRISDFGSIPLFVSISSFESYFSSMMNDLDRIEFHKFF